MTNMYVLEFFLNKTVGYFFGSVRQGQLRQASSKSVDEYVLLSCHWSLPLHLDDALRVALRQTMI